MKKHLFALVAFFAVFFVPAQAQITGWGYLNSFPWMYLEDEGSWAYLFVDGNNYWAYVQETGDYIYAGEVTSGGDAPTSLVGAVFVLQILDDGERGTATLTCTSETAVHVLVEVGDESFEATGTYDYERQGADTGLLLIEVVDEEDQIDSYFSLIFDDDGTGYYLSISTDQEDLPIAGEDGQYGVFTVVYSTITD